ncbi:MAG: polysaccharide export protein [Endomicrobiaceae bacterium]|jgi:polysaccharide export outer membrane protein|nr:polysaccharide export protein [Endomicrobiaceae bacterium]MDD3729460.1 polysaccharide export protein [Endomicrobiaceae bacterium]MDD4165593.1 polysaccharide export protein [Endomicrobiaceae bacterium]
MLKHFYFVFIITFLFSCSSVKNVVKNDNNDLPDAPAGYNQSLSKQVESNIAQLKSSGDYILQSGDLVDIKVFMETSMDRTLRISGSGTITFPLVGNIKIAGKSVAQAEEILSNELKKYIKNPQVSLLIKEYGNTTVYILGEVKTPSAIPIPPGKSLTVLEAISSVGGFTPIASTSKVKVLRMENGIQKSIEVDISQITKQGKKSLDIPLMPNDVVFVPQSIF